MVETQLLKPISFSSLLMVLAEIFLGPSLNIQVSCWTLFRWFAFTNRFRERLSRVFRNLALPLLPLNNCTSLSFFHWAIVLCTVLSPMAIIWDTSQADFPARCKPITCPLSKTEVRFVGFFPAWLFMLVVVESSCSSTDYQWDWTQLLLPYSFS